MRKQSSFCLAIFIGSLGGIFADTVVLRDGRKIRNVRTQIRGPYLVVKPPGRRRFKLESALVRRIIPAPIVRRKSSRRRRIIRSMKRGHGPRKAYARNVLSPEAVRRKAGPVVLVAPPAPERKAREDVETRYSGRDYWAFSPVSSPMLAFDDKWPGVLMTLGKIAAIYYYDLYAKPVRVGLSEGPDKTRPTVFLAALAFGNPVVQNWALDAMNGLRDPLTGRAVGRETLSERKASAAAALLVFMVADFTWTRVTRGRIRVSLPREEGESRPRLRLAVSIRF